ncbi:MAG TPA: DoxX family protein [Candidatus Tenderia electrophaga]|uniref:DoxX family protein n=1 Tax=Candidatus Tenderia electrophaga TaxID=1748243 RepID=A0A832J414_9GAMM|nr:DoxX family protein [Candidatus Tenderia electrophaga]
MEKSTTLIGRILLGQIFIIAGISKLGAGYAATQGWMEAMGVPGNLLPAVILLELAGGAALVLGFQTRLLAAALAGFSIISALIFHNNIADQMQMIMFTKNVAIAGGLLFVVGFGGGPWSLDARRSTKAQRSQHVAATKIG